MLKKNKKKFSMFKFIVGPFASHGFVLLPLKHRSFLYAFGEGKDGAVGIENFVPGGEEGVQKVPFFESNPKIKLKEVAVGKGFSVFLTTTGKIFITGFMVFHRLFDTSGLPNKPVSFSERFSEEKIVKVFCGKDSFFFLSKGHKLYGCGENTHGTLGISHEDTSEFCRTPQKVLIEEGIELVAAGWRHTLYLTLSKKVYSSGNNGSGRAGLGEYTTDRHGRRRRIKTFLVPTLIKFDQPIVNIQASSFFSMFQTADNRVYATGSNYEGKLAIGATNSRSVYSPVVIPTLKDVFDVKISWHHVLFIKLDGSCYSAGENCRSCLGLPVDGDEKLEFVATPSKIEFLQNKNIVQIHASSRCSYFISKDFDIYGCGGNVDGILFDETYDPEENKEVSIQRIGKKFSDTIRKILVSESERKERLDFLMKYYNCSILKNVVFLFVM